MADWAGTAEAYVRSFAQLTSGSVDALLDAAESAVPARGTLLDVGTGPGTVLSAALDRGWWVRGSDAEESMVEAARRRFPGVDIDLAALPELPYADGAFAAVTANFVVNHVPDPRAAVSELRRVASEVVVLTVWAGMSSPLRPLWDDVLDGSGLRRPPDRTLAPALDFERTESGLADVLSSAGLGDVTVSTVAWDFEIDPAELWLGVVGGVATIGGIHRTADARTRARMAAAYREAVATRVDARGRLVVPHAALLGVGRPRD